jgi:hypothetical protein
LKNTTLFVWICPCSICHLCIIGTALKIASALSQSISSFKQRRRSGNYNQMKKFLSVLALLVAVVAVSFATNVAPLTTESGSVTVREGRNVVRLRDGSTLTFMSRGGEIAGIEVRKPTGLLIKFDDEACSTCGNTQPPKPCTGEIRCSYSEKYHAKICFCMPKLDLSSGGTGGTFASDYLLEIDGVKGESR